MKNEALENTLKKILQSPWNKKYKKDILNFYQIAEDSKLHTKYGLYCYNIGRFMILDGLDLNFIYKAAQILSSKAILTLTVFKTPPPDDFSNENCLLWDVKNRNVFAANKQTPGLTLINGDEIIKAGYPNDFIDTKNNLVDDQEFFLFVLKVVVSAELANLSSVQSSNLVNPDFQSYLKLVGISEQSYSSTFESLDRTLWAGGFLNKVYSALYTANTINEVLAEFQKMIREQCDEETSLYRKIYLDPFKKFLGLEDFHA